MAEFQWWLLLVGLVAGGGLVAVVTMDGKRREVDIEELERRAEAGWIAERLAGGDEWVDAATVDAILRLHRDYLGMPPPDAILVDGEEADRVSGGNGGDGPTVDWLDGELDRDLGRDREFALDGDPDGQPDEIRDDGRGGTDQHLARAGEQEASAGQEAHAGADREQRADR
jgi:hypothetical protein